LARGPLRAVHPRGLAPRGASRVAAPHHRSRRPPLRARRATKAARARFLRARKRDGALRGDARSARAGGVLRANRTSISPSFVAPPFGCLATHCVSIQAPEVAAVGQGPTAAPRRVNGAVRLALISPWALHLCRVRRTRGEKAKEACCSSQRYPPRGHAGRGRRAPARGSLRGGGEGGTASRSPPVCRGHTRENLKC
jgi:hypothetical protein